MDKGLVELLEILDLEFHARDSWTWPVQVKFLDLELLEINKLLPLGQ